MNSSLRVAGWGTLGFAIAFVLTFAVNATLETVIDYPKLPTAADMAADFGGGVAFLLLWGSAGLALIVAAVGLPMVVWPRVCAPFVRSSINRWRAGDRRWDATTGPNRRQPRP